MMPALQYGRDTGRGKLQIGESPSGNCVLLITDAKGVTVWLEELDADKAKWIGQKIIDTANRVNKKRHIIV